MNTKKITKDVTYLLDSKTTFKAGTLVSLLTLEEAILKDPDFVSRMEKTNNFEYVIYHSDPFKKLLRFRPGHDGELEDAV